MIFSPLSQIKNAATKYDWVLIAATAILITIGLSTIQSTVIAGEGLKENLVNHQILAAFIGGALFFLIASFDYRLLTFITPIAYISVIILLISVLIFSPEIRGAHRWFVFGDFFLQPSEFAKPLLIISFAAFFAKLGEKINSLVSNLLSLILLTVPVVLIFLEPDLGTAAILVAVLFLMLFLSPIKLKKLILFLLPLVLLAPTVWFFLAPYQKTRLTSFLNPTADPLGHGYNVIQSQIAIGSGQITGRGWGRGTQSHLRFLPEQHTDFIFATFCEEQGLIGALVLFFLFGVLIWRGFRIAQRAPDLFGNLLAAGTTCLIFTQTAVNIGMSLGVLPVTGVSLPLLSYGGSSLVSTLISLGLLASVAQHSGKT